MTPDEFIFKLKSLPPDASLTPNHLIAVLEMISRSMPKNEGAIDSYPASKVISEEEVAEWIDESVNTLQKWRVTGKGPKFVKKPKNIGYRVGEIRDWLDNLTVSSTAESHVRLHRFDGEFFKPTPLILMATEPDPVPFFQSLLLPEESIEGFVLEYVEYYGKPEENLAAWFYNSMGNGFLSDLQFQANELLGHGAEINKKAMRIVGEDLIEFSVADLFANFHGVDNAYSDLLCMLLDNGLDISQVKAPTEYFTKIVNAHNLYQALQTNLK